MIPQRRSGLVHKLFMPYLAYRLRKDFNRFEYNKIDILPGHSILLLCNHFSWWDGFWAGQLAHVYLDRKFYIMMQEDHLQQRMFFNRLGGFSINRQSKEVVQSLQYAADLLNDPENLVTVFPQGALVSNHATEIDIERGIAYIVKKIKGKCQIIYYSALIDYFESLKPSVYLHLTHCGTNYDFDYERLRQHINAHHKKALVDQVNVDH
ncbi:lysophospholipid acyltransferase family protein [Mucilaginibacter sp. Bleaf8]|uniref:lysophospholipid acyltransferase family protein n=1 Tax=Mucilaginibacter sp. Bleaf8 TaxID=2834430 RepID=UPI001BD0F6B7|nr:lysophospholipid acyltransferase family protein [Mucilaginibacter sp. Bleaf8]MBS7566210.1 lysophospholipid acyltransferase family protein [Mucilaginibacter sp. Bleaf8]